MDIAKISEEIAKWVKGQTTAKLEKVLKATKNNPNVECFDEEIKSSWLVHFIEIELKERKENSAKQLVKKTIKDIFP